MNPIEQDVILLIESILKCNVDLTTNRINCEKWDSLKNIEIFFAIEDKFNIEFLESDISSISSITQFVEFILRQHES